MENFSDNHCSDDETAKNLDEMKKNNKKILKITIPNKNDSKKKFIRKQFTLHNYLDKVSSPFLKKNKLSRVFPNLLYRKVIWKKSFFVIVFFVKLFSLKLMKYNKKLKFAKLNKLHFDLINDVSHFHYNENSIDNLLKEKWRIKYQNIVQISHSNKLKIFSNKVLYCTFFLQNFI